MTKTLQELKVDIEREWKALPWYKKLYRGIREIASGPTTIKERVYQNLQNTREDTSEGRKYQHLVRDETNNPNPVWQYLHNRITSFGSLDIPEEKQALKRLESRTMKEDEYDRWEAISLRDLVKKNSCSVNGETLFNPYETEYPHRVFTVDAVVNKGLATSHDSYGGEGMLVGLLTGHFILGTLVGSTIDKSNNKPHTQIKSGSATFDFRTSGITLNKRELVDGEQLRATYREVYWLTPNGDAIPEQEDLAERIKRRKSIELLRIERVA